MSTVLRQMVRVEEAQRIILESVEVLPSEERGIREILGYVLAEDVYAELDIPPFANSAMDGFAVIAADTAGASEDSPVRLEVVEDLPAGYTLGRQLEQGQAVRIMTGAPLPQGADSIVMVEDTQAEGQWVWVRKPVQVGENVRPAGEDVRRGQLVLRAGTVIRPQEMGMLAALGRPRVRVVRCPRVALISTGEELVSLEAPLSPGKIRDSNRYSLYGQVLAAGGVPVDLGIVRDEPEVLRAKFQEALERADVLVTTGGVSVGDYDLVRGVFSGLGEIGFWRVAMKPGKPQLFALTGGKPIFGLPGNPVSAMIVFDQFVRPALRRMAGHRQLFRPTFLAVAEESIPKQPGRVEFNRARITERNGRLYARITGPQGSGILSSMVLANGLIILPQERGDVAPGEMVPVQFFHHPETLNWKVDSNLLTGEQI